MTAGFRVGHVTRSARHIFNHNLGRHRQTVRRPRNCAQMKKYLPANFRQGLPFKAITPPRQVASEPSHPRATAAVSRVCRREKRSTAMPDTGSPPGPPELAGTQPWPGFDKFSAVQVGARPGYRSRRPRACPPPPNRTTNLPRENRRARGAEGGRARPQRAPSTRRNARKKAPAHFFRAF